MFPGNPGTGITGDDPEHVGESRFTFRDRDFNVAATMPDSIIYQICEILRKLVRIAERFESCAIRQPIDQAGLAVFRDRSPGTGDLPEHLPGIAAFVGRQVFVKFNSPQ